MKPLGDGVFVEIIQVEKQKGGIIIPGNAQKRLKGKVIATGVKTETIQVSDVVQYHPNSRTKINYNSKDCLFLSEAHEVIAIL